MFITLGVQEKVLLISVRFVGFVDFVWEKVSINSINDYIQELPVFLM